MNFWWALLRNLGVLALIIGGGLIFAAIFYPQTLSVLYNVGEVYNGLNLWPIIILMVIVAAIPRRKRR